MAASKSYFPRPTYRFLPTERNGSIGSDSLFELHESDIWNSTAVGRSVSPEFQKSVVGGVSRSSSKKKLLAAAGKRSDASSSSSLPVNVPDWSKILKHEYQENRRRNIYDEDDDEEDEEDGGEGWVPPHEFLARQVDRTRLAFSVHEGIGRTLKGRDLSRVRNAIFEKTGFQD
ncbi:uncharacterized protein LOC124915371 [Impatiens glandulifera]|uniref:uncharacterized protein LOC124915371 n=1 Tax=Impatiens glandulifera TaxID=253017 RepID=UPI001FB0F5C4|nr:uncharacterized protein LOC124915371 [Impatiens glandulifera]